MRLIACLLLFCSVQISMAQLNLNGINDLNKDHIQMIQNKQLSNFFISSARVRLDADIVMQIREKSKETLRINAKDAKDVKVYVDNKSRKLTVHNPNLKEIIKLKIYDLKGSVVIDDNDLEVNDLYQYTTNKMHDGVYVAAIKLANNERLNQKLFIKKIP